MKPIRFIEINYYCHWEYDDPENVILKHYPSNLFAAELAKQAEVVLVKHMNYDGMLWQNNIIYRFFRRRNNFWSMPAAAHRFIAKQKPDVLLVQGLIFPLQVIRLRKKLGRNCIILLQHHGEVPFKRKKIFQRMADRSVDGYLFSSLETANEWCRSGIIKDISKCFELPPASFAFNAKNKEHCRRMLGMMEEPVFLWVGRLNANKDPLTVLDGVEQYFSIAPGKLYMIYQENDLLKEVHRKVQLSPVLKERVLLVGKIEHQELETWYSAADYIISGSHHEGGSYALIEAIACGCVPVVTNIPASMAAIDKGRLGFFYERGSAEDLFRTLQSVKEEDRVVKSKACTTHFENEMSAPAVSRKLQSIIQQLKAK